MFDRPFLPRDAAGLVGQYDATKAGTIGQHGLESIVAHTAGNWADLICCWRMPTRPDVAPDDEKIDTTGSIAEASRPKKDFT